MISTGFILDALLHYLSSGYSPLECPYSVPIESLRPTLPECSKPFPDTSVEDSYFVGSAEQGFIKLLQDGHLSPQGSYMAITPCLRDEPEFDDLHKQCFLKLELIAFNTHYLQVLQDAKEFFDSVGTTSIVNTSIGHDIFMNGIEVGSYGHRIIDNDISFSYGTGIAEPRLSKALEYKVL